MEYSIRYVRGHVEVYDAAGIFCFSADTLENIFLLLRFSVLVSYASAGVGTLSVKLCL